MVMGQAEVPPTPEAASTHEQPRAEGRSGLMTAQTGPDEEADEASTTPGVMASSMSRRVILEAGFKRSGRSRRSSKSAAVSSYRLARKFAVNIIWNSSTLQGLEDANNKLR